jgi:hypothetical protein
MKLEFSAYIGEDSYVFIIIIRTFMKAPKMALRFSMVTVLLVDATTFGLKT